MSTWRRKGRERRPHSWTLRILVLLAVAAFLTILARDRWPTIAPVAREYVAMRRVQKMSEVLLLAGNEAGVEPSLLGAIMIAESSGRVGVKSHKGALGLFQLMPVTAAERADKLGLPPPTEEQLLSDPLLNARLGADYMAWLLRRSEGNVERALVAYNTGPTRLNRWVRTAGSYDAWRDERRAAGNSDLMAYADKVLRYEREIRQRGLFD